MNFAHFPFINLRKPDMLRVVIGILIAVFAGLQSMASEGMPGDTLNLKFIKSLTLQGDVSRVLSILDTIKLTNQKDIEFKDQFEKRFKYRSDKSGSLNSIPSDIRPLVAHYHEYWRRALLDTGKADHEAFKSRLLKFLKKENRKKTYTTMPVSMETFDSVYLAYIRSKGYYAVEFGKTGFLYDLILWKDTKSTSYQIELIDDTVAVPVHFIDSFVVLSWISYAVIGRSSPGGWATKDALYCVKNGYDTTSEKFHVNYLKHEGQHFSDYKRFPTLPSNDLEYRGKLLEMYYGKEDLFLILQSFIYAARYDKSNSHPFANYCLIRDLSQLIFKKDYEEDLNRWKSLPPETIQQTARMLYIKNTESLRKGQFLK
jgi:hypothetical protein